MSSRLKTIVTYVRLSTQGENGLIAEELLIVPVQCGRGQHMAYRHLTSKFDCLLSVHGITSAIARHRG